MSAQFTQPLELVEALARMRERIEPIVAEEQLPLGEALGRVLAQPAISPLDLPPFDNSAMDGYAIAEPADVALQGRAFTLIGESAAGHPFAGSISPGECVRIFTGAAVPAGCRRVVLQEDTQAHGGQVRITGTPAPRTNIRSRGHDVTASTVLAEPGHRVNPFSVGRFAASGIAELSVRARPKVGVFSTGDELAPVGTPVNALPAGHIYESNRPALLALMADLPVTAIDLGNLPDDAEAVRTALTRAAGRCDAIVTSGGVSVGDHDHVKGAVEALGELAFWRLNLKPGKPLAFGRVGKAWFFGLPGNPVSTIVTWLLIARPALRSLCGERPSPPRTITAQLAEALQHSPGRTEYQRGRYEATGDSGLVVHVTGHQASNRLSTFADANCLIEVPDSVGNLAAGTPVTILPLNELQPLT